MWTTSAKWANKGVEDRAFSSRTMRLLIRPNQRRISWLKKGNNSSVARKFAWFESDWARLGWYVQTSFGTRPPNNGRTTLGKGCRGMGSYPCTIPQVPLSLSPTSPYGCDFQWWGPFSLLIFAPKWLHSHSLLFHCFPNFTIAFSSSPYVFQM